MIKPLNNYLLLEVKPEEEKTSGGLYMPQGSNSNATNILKEGVVVAASENAVEKLGIKISDKVYYNKHAITKVPEEDNLVLVRLEDLYGIIS